MAVDRNLSNCEIARKKKKNVFWGFNGIRTRDLSVRAVLYQLSYEDPYTGGRPIYWVHQLVKGTKHRLKLCELREYLCKFALRFSLARDGHLFTCDKAVAMYFPPAAPITILTLPDSSKMMEGEAKDMGRLRGFKASSSRWNSFTHKFKASHSWLL